MWCIPKLDKEYITKMLDVLEVYERPYNPDYPVVCFDEKSKQLLADTRQSIAAKPGQAKRVDYEYKRNGTVNLFVAIEPKGKKRQVTVTKHRKKSDFAKVIQRLVMQTYTEAKKIVLVTDNLNTHTKQVILEYFGRTEGRRIVNRIEWHYTPKHASWLNMAEIEIGILSNQALNNNISIFQDMQKQVAAWSRKRNNKGIGINWQFTRNKAKKKFRIKNNHTIGKLNK